MEDNIKNKKRELQNLNTSNTSIYILDNARVKLSLRQTFFSYSTSKTTC